MLAVVYLIFNEGHVATSGGALIRDDLCGEAIRLARLLVELMPDEGEAQGLLALLLLTEARRPARAAADGSLVRLGDQDRSLWDRALIDEGHDLVRACLRRNMPGPYQIQAAIAAVHADATTADATDWSQIVQLYDQLLPLMPTPIVALNRAIAVAELDGPGAGVGDPRPTRPRQLPSLSRRPRRPARSVSDRPTMPPIAYDRAIDLATNDVEQDHLRRRRDALTPSHGDCDRVSRWCGRGTGAGR